MTSDSTGTNPVHHGPSQERLLKLVKLLGIIMVLLFFALIAGIIWKATHRPPPAPATSVIMELGIDMASVKHMTLDGDRLALATDKELLVIDVRKREVLLRTSK
jgi:hypothetical protein